MAYNPQNAQPTNKAQLETDSIYSGTLIEIEDGKLKDWLPVESIRGDPEQPAINLIVELKPDEKKQEFIRISQVFSYFDENGATKFTPKSNLGKFWKKYGSVPVVGMMVKVQTDGEGFGKIKLE